MRASVSSFFIHRPKGIDGIYMQTDFLGPNLAFVFIIFLINVIFFNSRLKDFAGLFSC